MYARVTIENGELTQTLPRPLPKRQIDELVPLRRLAFRESLRVELQWCRVPLGVPVQAVDGDGHADPFRQINT